MKKLLLLLLPLAVSIQAQTVQSTCTAHDSIIKKYIKKDADRLAVRRTYATNSTLKDSIRIDQVLSKMYQDALLAVYNATSLPVRDTVVKIYTIHTNPEPGLNGVEVKADPNAPWMQNIFNNISPTGDPTIDMLMTKYAMHPAGYYQGQGYDLVVFQSDTNYNTPPLALTFTPAYSVIDADPSTGFDDTRNITDSVATAFRLLKYTYGWGTCANGCDYHTTWKFKVYNDCSVEYLGQSGDILNTGITARVIPMPAIYPNPVQAKLTIEGATGVETTYTLRNLLGETVATWRATGTTSCDVGQVKPGLYTLTVKNKGESTIKIIKQ